MEDNDNNADDFTYEHDLRDLSSSLLELAAEELSDKGVCSSHMGSFRGDFFGHTYPEKYFDKYSSYEDGYFSCPSGKDRLSEDTRNLLFSHFPRNLGTDFRFKVGELAYIKWHDELCLVVVNFVSQKLVACSDNAFDDEGESETSKSSQCNPNASKVDSEDRNKVLDTAKIPGIRRSVWLSDNNEDLFVDADSHELYSRPNALQPIRLSFPEGEDFEYEFACGINSESDFNSEAQRMIVRHYFMPVYFVTFPGYKRRCARTFRFWVKEKDLIKLNSVNWPQKQSQKPKINLTYSVGDSPIERVWAERDIENINEYVYNIVHNRYYCDVVSGRFSSEFGIAGEIHLPWNVPKVLWEIVSRQQRLIIGSVFSTAESVPPSFERIFSTAPLFPRLCADSIVQNFKYLLILMGNLMKKTNDLVATAKVDEESVEPYDSAPDEDTLSDLEFDEMCVPSLRLLGHLETAVECSLTYQQFFESYINNFYWLDLFLFWMDTNFLDQCCYNRQEHEFISRKRSESDRKLCEILGFEHLSRIFCFSPLYSNFLQRVRKNNRPFMAYLPITQLFVQYLAFVADDYHQSHEYGIDADTEFPIPRKP